jgi:signal transduction histidine kinase
LSSPSLKARLFVGAAIWIGLALLLAGAAIHQLFLADVARQRDADLAVSLERLVASVALDGELAVEEGVLSNPLYETQLSGLYWQVRDLATGEAVRSRSLWDTELEIPPSQNDRLSVHRAEIVGPRNQRLAVLSRHIVVEGSAGDRDLQVAVAESVELRSEQSNRFGTDLALALLLVGLALSLAAWFQVHLGLLPLRRLRSGLESIRLGRSEALPPTFPREVIPLVDELNALLASHEDNVATARRRAADLAHSLKTPLSVLRATAERLRADDDAANADVLDTLCDEMTEKVSYQLRLARLRQRGGSVTGVAASLSMALIRSVSMLRKTETGESLHWRLDLAEDLWVAVDQHDLMELVGILLDNAAKWATSQVKVFCGTGQSEATIFIEDDGNGLNDEQIVSLGKRGTRFDESRPGDGLGLAIAVEIVELNQGSMTFRRGDSGGLAVDVSLPLAARPSR